MTALTACWRSIFAGQIANTELLTSYSFRRVSTTLASAVGVPWELRLALGAWQGDIALAQRASQGSLMPARYSDNRCDIQAITKLACQMVLQDMKDGLQYVAGGPAHVGED